MKITETTLNYIESPAPEDGADCEANQEEEIQGLAILARDMPNVWTHDMPRANIKGLKRPPDLFALFGDKCLTRL